MSVSDDHQDPISAEAKLPPIFNLSEDVLLHIFMMNTHNMRMRSKYVSPFDIVTLDSMLFGCRRDRTPRPLQHTRFSSQVCREWRNILLLSTSIWGRLVDFYSFNNFSDHWRDEVIRRSGSSMLWIIGGSDCMTPKKGPIKLRLNAKSDFDSHMNRRESFFWKFLHDNWERTEKLCINGWEGRDFDFLWHSAPDLKALHYYSAPYLSTHGNPDDIFTRHAPRFMTQGSKFLPNINCMSKIQHLSLGTNDFTNQDIMELLPLLPLIETLNLQSHTMVEGYQSPIVHLPRLRILKLGYCIGYLHTIKPSSKCSFIIKSNIDAFMTSRSIHLDALASIYHDYLALHHRDKITLGLAEYRLYLSAGSLLKFNLPDHDVFELAIESPQGNTTALVALLEPFISRDKVELSFHLAIMVPNYKLHPTTRSVIKRFLYPFTSVKSITFKEEYLGLLFAEELVPPIIFPQLQSLKLVGPHYKLRELQCFLDSRRKHGVPIAKVDVTSLDISKISPEDRNALEEHKGMIVCYETNGSKIQEYVCGSGHPAI